MSRAGATRIRGSVDSAFIQRVITDLQREQRPSSNISAADIDMGNPLLLTSLPPEAAAGTEAENELSHAFALRKPSLQVGEDEAVEEGDTASLEELIGTGGTQTREEEVEPVARGVSEAATVTKRSAATHAASRVWIIVTLLLITLCHR